MGPSTVIAWAVVAFLLGAAVGLFLGIRGVQVLVKEGEHHG